MKPEWRVDRVLKVVKKSGENDHGREGGEGGRAARVDRVLKVVKKSGENDHGREGGEGGQCGEGCRDIRSQSGPGRESGILTSAHDY